MAESGEPKQVTQRERIELLEVGETVAFARRVSLVGGIVRDEISGHRDIVRGVLDKQTNRVRKAFPDRVYTVEVGEHLTSNAALLIFAAVSRLQ